MSGSYYVYCLSTQVGGAFDVENILYVGKGKGFRWRAHFDEALSELGASEKAQILRSCLSPDPDEDEIESHAWIVAGNLDEPTAFLLESALIKLWAGQLTNIAPGRDSAALFAPATHVRRFFSATPHPVALIPAADLPQQVKDHPTKRLILAVKGSKEQLGDREVWTKTTSSDRMPQANVWVDPAPISLTRRGWDASNPWNSGEAQERARRYWRMSAQSVEAVQTAVRQSGALLAMLVQDPAGRSPASVVRYIWHIADAPWEDYAEIGRVGMPLGEHLDNHPLLGTIPHQNGRGVARETGPAYFFDV